MILKALRRAGTRKRIVIISLLLFGTGMLGAVGVTSAFFQAELDTKTATFAGGYLAVPTIVGVRPTTSPTTTTTGGSGYDGVLTWTNGTDETTTANEIQQILGSDRGTTNNCTGATYGTTVLTSTTSPTTTQAFTYTDSNRATTPSNINGDWYCYEIVHGWPNTTTPDWTAAATTNVQIGLAPTSVAITNSGTANSVTNGDAIVITYNQPVTMTSGSGSSTVCSYQTEGVILLGDSCPNTGTATGDTYTVGKLTISVTNGGEHKKANATITLGTGSNGLTTSQIKVAVTQNGPTVSNSSISFVSSSHGGTVVSAVTTDRATACTSAAATCTLSTSAGTVTGGF